MGTHYERGIMLYKLRNYKLAEKEFRDALLAEPDSSSRHSMLAMTLNALGKSAPAHKEALEAVRLDPEHAYAHYTLSFTFMARSNTRAAEKAILEAIRIEPKDSTYYARAANLYSSLRNYQKALEFADRGLSCNAEDVSCLIVRSSSLSELGRTEEADRTADTALTLAPENASAHLRKGSTQLVLGNKTEAFTHYRESLRLDPTLNAARVGAISALKSRSGIYYWFLRSSLAIRRMPKALLIVLLVLFLVPGIRLLVGLYYLAFLLAENLHLLLLRFDPQGKTLLTKTEIARNNIHIGIYTFVALSLAFVGVLAVVSPDSVRSNKPPVLTDNQSYVKYAQQCVKKNWHPPSRSSAGATVVSFIVAPDGEVSESKVVKSSGNGALDLAALDAINESQPLPHLPSIDKRPVAIRLTFDYKIKK